MDGYKMEVVRFFKPEPTTVIVRWGRPPGPSRQLSPGTRHIHGPRPSTLSNWGVQCVYTGFRDPVRHPADRFQCLLELLKPRCLLTRAETSLHNSNEGSTRDDDVADGIWQALW